MLRYLKGFPSKGLYFPISDNLQPQAYCDAGLASCLDTRRSLTGFCVFLGSALVIWRTKNKIRCLGPQLRQRTKAWVLQRAKFSG